MQILSIVGDQNIANPRSEATQRQMAYFNGISANIVVLNVGEKIQFELGAIRVLRPGGLNHFLAFINTWRAILKMGQEKRYNIIITQDVTFTGLIGLFFSFWWKVPLVVQLHGDYLNNPAWIKQRPINYVMNCVGKWVLRHSDAVRCVSERIRRQVVEEFGISKSRSVSIPIGTDLNTFQNFSPHVREPIFLFVGRLILEKDPLLFIRSVLPVIKKYPQVRAVIAGDGSLRTEMEAYLRSKMCHDRFSFIGNVDKYALAGWYGKSLCLVHTAPWEGWGMPMIEALASGCVVITTDTGCALEAVRPRDTGLVVSVGDEVELTASMIELIENPSLAAALAQAGKKEAQRWSFDTLKEKLLTFYTSYARKY